MMPRPPAGAGATSAVGGAPRDCVVLGPPASKPRVVGSRGSHSVPTSDLGVVLRKEMKPSMTAPVWASTRTASNWIWPGAAALPRASEPGLRKTTQQSLPGGEIGDPPDPTAVARNARSPWACDWCWVAAATACRFLMAAAPLGNWRVTPLRSRMVWTLGRMPSPLGAGATWVATRVRAATRPRAKAAARARNRRRANPPLLGVFQGTVESSDIPRQLRRGPPSLGAWGAAGCRTVGLA